MSITIQEIKQECIKIDTSDILHEHSMFNTEKEVQAYYENISIRTLLNTYVAYKGINKENVEQHSINIMSIVEYFN